MTDQFIDYDAWRDPPEDDDGLCASDRENLREEALLERAGL